MPAHVVSVYATKGGVGKTTLAVNLAVDMLLQSQRRVLLFDYSFSLSADASAMLGLDRRRTVVEILPLVHDEDPDLLEGFLPRHGSGLDVLTLAVAPEQLVGLQPDDVVRTVKVLAGLYDYIVIDVSGPLNEMVVGVLDVSKVIFLMTTTEVLAANQCRAALEQLRTMHFPANQIMVVANQVGKPGGVDMGRLPALLERPIKVQLPYDPERAASAANKAVPLVVAYPRSSLSTRIDRLTLYLISRRDGGKGFLEAIADRRSLLTGRASSSLDARGDVASDYDDLDAHQHYMSRVNALKRAVHGQLVERLNLKHVSLEKLEDADPQQKREVRQQTEKVIAELVDELGDFLRSREERRRIVLELVDEALGLGPLENMLADPEITEIMVNAADRIYIERGGKIYLTDHAFADDKQLLGVIERIVAPLGRRIDESTPYVDARLPDGSRVNAIIPPLAIQGPTLTIRKFSATPLTADDLVRMGAMSEAMRTFLQACVRGRRNILISGGTSTGKTTFLNVLASFIPERERIITIEDAAELQLPQEHVVRLEARPANIEGGGEITIRDLVRNALRMRPDRIVVGECRGGESLDMLQAMNTGHDGSLTTIHANSPRDSLSRLETTVLFSGFEIPSKAIRQQIGAAINLVLQMERAASDGSRRVVSIAEIAGLDKDEFIVKEIFVFHRQHVDAEGRVHGKFLATGYIPEFVWELQARGIDIDPALFDVAPEDRKLLEAARNSTRDALYTPAAPASRRRTKAASLLHGPR